MFGLAARRCSLGRRVVQPVRAKTVSAPKPSKTNRWCKGVVLSRNPGSVFMFGIGKRSGEKFYSLHFSEAFKKSARLLVRSRSCDFGVRPGVRPSSGAANTAITGGWNVRNASSWRALLWPRTATLRRLQQFLQQCLVGLCHEKIEIFAACPTGGGLRAGFRKCRRGIELGIRECASRHHEQMHHLAFHHEADKREFPALPLHRTTADAGKCLQRFRNVRLRERMLLAQPRAHFGQPVGRDVELRKCAKKLRHVRPICGE